MGRPSGNIQSLERATGIKILSPDQLTVMGRPKVCYCAVTLKNLMRRYGQSHVEHVIDLLVQTDNGDELYSATIYAVSDLLLSHPQLLELGGGLYDLFDQIDMKEMRLMAKDIDKGNRRIVLKAILSMELRQSQKEKAA